MLPQKFSISHQIVLSFVAVILLGTVLLHLPSSSGEPEKVKLRDCLFTATSAVCVTGLTVKDTGTEFSFAGQAIILGLIQIGGLGILTFSNWLLISFQGRRTDFETRLLLSESHGSLPHVEPVRLLKQIVFYTLLCEAVGALLLYLSFSRDHPSAHAAWLAVFHSVAAFCNAGFSLFPDSLIGYRGDLTVNLTIDILIILGGLGFLVFSDITEYFTRRRPDGRRRRLSFHSRVVLWTTVTLISVFTGVFLILEWNNTMAGLPMKDRLLASLMLSITPRTAGFNSVDTGALTNITLCVLIFLMGIGASPGSTGGGIKTTTFAVLVALMWSRVRSTLRIELLGRAIPLNVLAKTVAVGAAYALVTIISVMIMEVLESP
ncbi:MAG: hypothetical protein HUU16_21065, partial [Candidatus Omnitrophica bacterium]|nr:hypothetical protein [Candidatus Omnitrophota bacterium]